MFKILSTRLRQGRRTVAFPKAEPNLPERLRGRPELDPSKCPEGCRACSEACPTDAIRVGGAQPLAIDLGRCLFCPECVAACPRGAIRFTRDYRLATRGRDDLITDGRALELARALDRRACASSGARCACAR